MVLRRTMILKSKTDPEAGGRGQTTHPVNQGSDEVWWMRVWGVVELVVDWQLLFAPQLVIGYLESEEPVHTQTYKGKPERKSQINKNVTFTVK